MALIKCEECGKEISDKSKVCVNCGCPIKKTIKEERKEKKEKTKLLKAPIKIMIAFLIFIIGIVMLFGISKGIEKSKEKKVLNNIVGTWEHKEISKNGFISYDVLTFSKKKNFKYTSSSNTDFAYGYEGTMSIYADGEIWLYNNNGNYLMHLKYDSEYDELYEISNVDNSKIKYTKKQ